MYFYIIFGLILLFSLLTYHALHYVVLLFWKFCSVFALASALALLDSDYYFDVSQFLHVSLGCAHRVCHEWINLQLGRRDIANNNLSTNISCTAARIPLKKVAFWIGAIVVRLQAGYCTAVPYRCTDLTQIPPRLSCLVLLMHKSDNMTLDEMFWLVLRCLLGRGVCSFDTPKRAIGLWHGLVPSCGCPTDRHSRADCHFQWTIMDR